MTTKLAVSLVSTCTHFTILSKGRSFTHDFYCSKKCYSAREMTRTLHHLFILLPASELALGPLDVEGKKDSLAERSFDLRSSGLWAQHASTAPLCCPTTRGPCIIRPNFGRPGHVPGGARREEFKGNWHRNRRGSSL